MNADPLRVHRGIRGLARQADALHSMLNELPQQPDWPASTAESMLDFYQELHGVAENSLGIIGEYLRLVPRPTAPPANSRYLQRLNVHICTVFKTVT